MVTESQILSSFSPRACPRCMLTCFSAGDPPSPLYICRGPSTNQLFFNKQSQFRESSNERKYLLYKGLSNFYPAGGAKKQTQFKPNQTQSPKSPNERKLNFNKGLQKKRHFRSPKKQTQFKPNFFKGQNERKLICYRGLQKKR